MWLLGIVRTYERTVGSGPDEVAAEWHKLGRGSQSDFCPFRYFQGVLDVDTEITNGAVDLGMTKQDLDSA